MSEEHNWRLSPKTDEWEALLWYHQIEEHRRAADREYHMAKYHQKRGADILAMLSEMASFIMPPPSATTQETNDE